MCIIFVTEMALAWYLLVIGCGFVIFSAICVRHCDITSLGWGFVMWFSIAFHIIYTMDPMCSIINNSFYITPLEWMMRDAWFISNGFEAFLPCFFFSPVLLLLFMVFCSAIFLIAVREVSVRDLIFFIYTATIFFCDLICCQSWFEQWFDFIRKNERPLHLTSVRLTFRHKL